MVSHNEFSRSRKTRDLEVAAVAAQHDIPVLLPSKLGEVYDQLAAFGAEAGVLVAYGKIVPQRIIDLFPFGIINIHPSALPLHRGPIPLESVILDGSTQTAVSLMALAAAMDAGPVYAQQAVELTGHETKQELADRLSNVGQNMMERHLASILDGSLQPMPQTDADATYDNLIQKADGVIDWNKPAIQLEREVRAYAGWPKSRTTLGGIEIAVTKAHVAGEGDDGLSMQTSEGTLIIDELIPAGKKAMSGCDFLRGYKL